MELSSGPCFSLCAVARLFVAYPETRTLGLERVDPRSPCLGFLISSSRIDVLRSAPLRRAPPAVALPKKSVFNLSVDAMQPLLRSVGPLSIGHALSFQFCNPIFGCAQLIGKLLSHAQRATAVLFSNAGGLVNQLQYRLSCFVELVDVAWNVVRSGRKPDDFRVLSRHSRPHCLSHPGKHKPW